MLTSPKLLKNRILIGLLYSCGLRCQEVRNLELKHIDFDRKMLHVVQGKGKKDRYIPLSVNLIRGIKKYISEAHPPKYLFQGGDKPELSDKNSKYSIRGIQSVVCRASKRAGILKEVYPHTLRHTFASHLLEDGASILTVQKLLGHSSLQTTLVYLNVCTPPEQLVQNPLDKIFEQCSRAGK